MSKTNYSSEEMQRYFNDPEYRRKAARRALRWTVRHWIALVVGGGLTVVLLTWYSVYIFSGLPSLERLENPRPELATKIYAADGEVIDQLFYKNRTRVAIDTL